MIQGRLTQQGVWGVESLLREKQREAERDTDRDREDNEGAYTLRVREIAYIPYTYPKKGKFKFFKS